MPLRNAIVFGLRPVGALLIPQLHVRIWRNDDDGRLVGVALEREAMPHVLWLPLVVDDDHVAFATGAPTLHRGFAAVDLDHHNLVERKL